MEGSVTFQFDELVGRRVWIEALRKYAAIRRFTDDGQIVLEFSPADDQFYGPSI